MRMWFQNRPGSLTGRPVPQAEAAATGRRYGESPAARQGAPAPRHDPVPASGRP